MISIIKRLFEQNGFENTESFNIPDEQVLFMRNVKKNSVNFYLLLFTDNIDSIFSEKKVLNYYEKIIQINDEEYDERIDKNLSLIVFLKKNENITDPNLMNKIFNLEENPYYFKKYVCTYTNKQEEELKDIFPIPSKNDKKLNDILNNYVNNEKKFKKFKKKSEEESLYKLCITLFVKIPFLILKQKNEEIDNLQQQIQNELDTKKLADFYNSIEAVIKADEFEKELEQFYLKWVQNNEL